ncbi:FecR family protein [Chitinophaga qingshengii]|uniref:FecR domain-containing protein n=1 Tax=Chitinophaga qingshengii TaxID=1569794 RepID=A0ABR7TXC3_9BACT|nr:FecR domain-containing protein [Chitinophaga qingshengii]MBC9934740.1 FecR domain-containing protein [Chitinophaga qingshengii]
MARKISGEATTEELKELEMLLMQFPELQYAFTIVEDIQTVNPANGFTPEEESRLASEGMDRINLFLQQEQDAPVRKLPPWKMMAGIAAMITVLLTVWALWPVSSDRQAFRNEVVTKTGSKTSVVLPDGTTVVLNACSRLQYDATRFLQGEREVGLIGEAYFDVKHDPAHPFIIRTGPVNIRVLGTVFNVKAYTEDATVETTLLSGKVEVSFPQGSDSRKVVLEPDQKLIIANQQNQPAPDHKKANFSISPVKNIIAGASAGEDADKPATAWINDRFDFDNVTFEALSHDLERWYNVTLRFKNDRYKHEVFTGAFRKQGIEDVLQALQLMSGFHYEVNTKENIIYIW